MKIINVEQKTPEWFEARKLKMTASNATAVMANGAGLKTYILELVSEYLSSGEKEHFTNEHIERGNELEDSAIFAYECLNNVNVERVGFVEYSKYVGCSPDGLVGDDGLIEIKCKSDKNHLKQIVEGSKGIESGYINQIKFQLYCTGRKWCDFVAYNNNFEKDLFIHRVVLEDADIEKIEIGISAGEKLIEEYLEKYEKF